MTTWMEYLPSSTRNRTDWHAFLNEFLKFVLPVWQKRNYILQVGPNSDNVDDKYLLTPFEDAAEDVAQMMRVLIA